MEYGYLSGAGGGFEGGCLGTGGGELSWGELASCGQMSQAAYRYQGMRYQPPPPQCARPQDAAMRNHHIFPPAMNLQREYTFLYIMNINNNTPKNVRVPLLYSYHLQQW
jgi:hypothetical protein